MKVLVVSNLYPPDVIGGYEICCKQVADSLKARGHEVLVLTTAPRLRVPELAGIERSMQLTELWSDFVNARCTSPTIRLAESEGLRLNPFNVDRLFNAIERFRPDVVYLCSLVGIGGLGLLAALAHVRMPWVWQLGDNVPTTLCRRDAPGENELAREVARQLRGSYIAVSHRLVREIEASGIPLLPKLEILPNWIVGDRVPARRPYQAGEPLRIVMAGRLVREKGVEVLIDAARILRERGHEDFTVDLFGKVIDLTYPSLVRVHGLERHVRFLGALPQEQMVKRLSDYDVFAMPTEAREPFGVAPLEAASRGCVPILSRECGIAEWLVDGVHCLKAERNGPSFADRFESILKGEIDLARIARRVHAMVWRDFHLDAVVPKIERLLAEAAGQSRDGAGSPEEFYRLAIIAERLMYVLVQESFVA